METSLMEPLNDRIRKEFSLKNTNIQEYSPLTLAYIGDCVYDLVIKTIYVSEGNQPVQMLHEKTSSLVNARMQSKMMRILQSILTKEELDVFKRGRNTKSVSAAKNQSITDYRRATGFEALMGYLYLSNQYERMTELIKIGLDSLKEKEK